VVKELTPLQQYFSYIVAVISIDGGNQSTQRKPDLPQVTDKYTSPSAGFTLTTLMAIEIDCTGSCKSNDGPS
jgi:hypothetical protein